MQVERTAIDRANIIIAYFIIIVGQVCFGARDQVVRTCGLFFNRTTLSLDSAIHFLPAALA